MTALLEIDPTKKAYLFLMTYMWKECQMKTSSIFIGCSSIAKRTQISLVHFLQLVENGAIRIGHSPMESLYASVKLYDYLISSDEMTESVVSQMYWSNTTPGWCQINKTP